MGKNTLALLFLSFALLFATASQGASEKADRTVVLTAFDAAEAGSYAYLRDSVRGIITSRLATRPGITVLDRSLSREELTALKERQAGAKGGGGIDYLIAGGLYGLKGGLSIHVTLYPMAAEEEVQNFQVVSRKEDTLLADLEGLVESVARAVRGKTEDAAVEQATGGAAQGNAAFVTAHPEAAYKKKQFTGAVSAAEGSNIVVEAKEGKRNTSFGGEIRLFAVGDVDGGGDEEMVVLSGSTMELYRTVDKKIVKAGGGKLDTALECHAMNLADLDSDGREEIYLSCTSDLAVASAVVRWQPATAEFIVSAGNIPWYLRPLQIPGKGWRLAGQKRGMEKAELLKPGVYLLEGRQGGGYVEQERLPLPTGLNLFDFVYADLDGDRSYETVAIDGKERLRVYSSANELLSVSSNSYGGSKIYIGPSRSGAVNDQDRRNFTLDEDMVRRLDFVPGRLQVSDVDGNGREEVVINRNSLSVMSILEKMRIYTDGFIVGLTWDGEQLNEAWRSGSFRGYIVGFSLTPRTRGRSWPAGTPGKAVEAVLSVAHLPRSGSLVGLLPGVGETQLTSYELTFSSVKTK